jgi:hypothetical protein
MYFYIKKFISQSTGIAFISASIVFIKNGFYEELFILLITIFFIQYRYQLLSFLLLIMH